MKIIDKRKRVSIKNNELKLLELLASLDKKYPSLLIVVEGQHDEVVLRNAGVSCKILRIHLGNSISDVIDHIAYHENQEVLILTDFDKEGISLCHQIEKGLEGRKVKVLQGLRLRIRALMGNLRCIEELNYILKKQEWREWR